MMDERENMPRSLLPEVMSRLELASRSALSAQGPAEALKSPAWRERVATVNALAERRDGASLALLLTALDDEDETVRATSVRALSAWGKRIPLSRLLLALRDPSWQMREAAVLALGRLNERVAAASLQAALRDENAFVREAAAMDPVGADLSSAPPIDWQDATIRVTQAATAATEADKSAVRSINRRLRGGFIRGGFIRGGFIAGLFSGSSSARMFLHTLLPFLPSSKGGDMLEEFAENTDYGIYPSSAREQHKRPRSMRRVAEGFVAVLLVAALIVSWFALAHGLQGQGTADRGNTLGQYDTTLGAPVWTYHSPDQSAEQIGWTADGRYFTFFSAQDGLLHLLDIHTIGQKTYDITDPNMVSGVNTHPFGAQTGFSPDGRYAFAADDFGGPPAIHVEVWDVESGQIVLNYTYSTPSALTGGPILSWSNDSSRIAVGDNNGRVLIWNAITRQQPFLLYGYNAAVNAISWSQGGQLLAAATGKGEVEIWNVATSKRIFAISGMALSGALALSTDGSKVAFETRQHTIQVWNAVTGKHLSTYQESSLDLMALQWAQDRLVIVNTGTGKPSPVVRILNTTMGQALVSIPVADFARWSLSPDGSYVAVEQPNQKTTQVWDCATGKLVAVLSGAKMHPLASPPVWSPDSKYIATVRADDALQVWNVTSGQILYTYQGDANAITQIVWSSDGKYLATMGTKVTNFNASNDTYTPVGVTINIWRAALVVQQRL